MSNFPSVQRILHHLVEIPSPYPFENKIANWVSSFLENHNFRVHKVPVENRFCIVGERGTGNTLLLFGHLDTVPIQGVEDENPHNEKSRQKIIDRALKLGWTQDPFTPLIKEGKMYGNGAIDMKAGVASILATAISLPVEWFSTRKLKLAFSIDEEYVDKGMYQLLQTDLLRDVQGCICPEIADISEVVEIGETPDVGTILLGRRGRIAIEVLIKGKAAHAATPKAGINAIELGAKVIAHVMKSVESGNLQLGTHDLLPNASLTPLKIYAGTSSLSVPDSCLIEFDRHLVPPETPEFVLKQLKTCINEVLDLGNFQIRKSIRPTPFLLPFVTPKDSKIAQISISALESLGYNVRFSGGNSVADENMLSSPDYQPPILHAIPTIGLGCKGGNYHKDNEWVDLDSLENHQIALMEICKNWT
ncbi:M20 family metallopeptidase [Promethearchaeum syntrophicum]|uniref:M20 family metallopeptidase n=1 Tax=Promethearchaeum syntrophicum TaxID=2594042 RepID=A0A5B9DD00_9ARCH|nr:M20/M25/M40 family metallo-hydrolase [Candidatus Prometheoarchaeum syntrophicum]QEE16643.1 putative metallohydrolase [Candidatus Prometheoarchaeum syntrophicum]